MERRGAVEAEHPDLEQKQKYPPSLKMSIKFNVLTKDLKNL